MNARAHAAKASELLESCHELSDSAVAALGELRGRGIDGPLNAAGEYVVSGVAQIAALAQAHALTALALEATDGHPHRVELADV